MAYEDGVCEHCGSRGASFNNAGKELCDDCAFDAMAMEQDGENFLPYEEDQFYGEPEDIW